ncbi:MAG TPA: hypothetical protein O0X25_01730 [Methanocorpusculum sp.]|nr:hypothetical protein [Methanocorpusculum sp.]HJJ39717.1 hypothetical protein [Methanocorpusculum sp.]HJJ49326.1 hypothetical protein [Methanocorpusculum sp.]HJJ56630.1 hypothetical protein [Methanocorpusculum sp.]
MRLVLTQTNNEFTSKAGDVLEGAIDADTILDVHVETVPVITYTFKGEFHTYEPEKPALILVAEMIDGHTRCIADEVWDYVRSDGCSIDGKMIIRIMCERLIKALAEVPNGSIIAPWVTSTKEGNSQHLRAATHYLFSKTEFDNADLSNGYWTPQAEYFTAEEVAAEIKPTTYAVQINDWNCDDALRFPDSMAVPREE